MASDTRSRMIAATARLLAQRGLEGASLADILEAAKAPRGSVYHHFPGGKDQLVGEAVDLAGKRSLEAMDGLDGQSPAIVAGRFLDGWRELLVRTQYRAGCAVLAVTMAADSDLLRHADAVFASWIQRLTQLFVEGGLSPEPAADLATGLVAATEGAVAISRAQRDLHPFEVVASQLMEQVRAMSTVA
ncbi:MAG: TetR/AcrR family transcriptional regulator [Candidatus Limnocylindrales bacterium]